MLVFLRSQRAFLWLLLIFTVVICAWNVWVRESAFTIELRWWHWAALSGVLLMSLVALLRRQYTLPSGETLWRLLGLTLLLNATTNPMFFVVPVQPHVGLMMTMGALCVLWALMGRLSLLFWVPFILLDMAQIAAFFQYGTRFNSLVLAETLEASTEEILAYMSVGNAMLTLCALLVACFYGWLIRGVLQRQLRSSLLGAGALFCLLAVVYESVLPPHRQSAGQHFWPFGEIGYLYDSCHEALAHNIAVVKLAEGLRSPAEEPSVCENIPPDAGFVLVVHIGESVRADAMSINGYKRDTTPWLRRQPGVINFPDCISAACDTCQAQIVLLTDARRGIYDTAPGMQPTTGSVLDVLGKHGFDVYSFMGRRCGQQLKYDRVVRVLTHVSKERFNAPAAPWTALPQMRKVLQENPQKNLLFFVNNEGSHTPFSYYDQDDPPFTPAGTGFENPASNAVKVRNAYDNTIHYTDTFWKRACEQLKGRPFVYVYVSDHGEYLGQNGIWGRGGLGDSKVRYHDTDGCRVGMFIYASPEFEAASPHFAEALSNLRRNASMTVGHEHLFHTLLGLFGVHTRFYNPLLDLCSSRALPYDGPQPAAAGKEQP